MLEFKTLIFYVFSVVCLSAAIGVIASRHAVFSALWLIATFVATAGIWLLLHAEFLAIVLVLVYVGAVMVLFLFVLMMLDIKSLARRSGWYLPIACLVVTTLVGVMTAVLGDNDFIRSQNSPVGEIENTRALASLLYTDYVYPFELAAIILLVAIIAAIALTLRKRRDQKNINPNVQVEAQPHQRLTLVDLSDSPSKNHPESY